VSYVRQGTFSRIEERVEVARRQAAQRVPDRRRRRQVRAGHAADKVEAASCRFIDEEKDDEKNSCCFVRFGRYG